MAFAFTKTWEAEEIEDWIHAIPSDTFIQVDDYGGYSAKLEAATEDCEGRGE